MTLVEYRCNLCRFKTTIRKQIRTHVKEVHGMTGGHDSLHVAREPLSTTYTRKILK